MEREKDRLQEKNDQLVQSMALSKLEWKTAAADKKEEEASKIIPTEDTIEDTYWIEYRSSSSSEEKDGEVAYEKQEERTVAEWIEHTTEYPTPHFDIDSTEIQYLLKHWSPNRMKRESVQTWMHQLLDGEEPCQALELSQVSPEIRDGFLILVVPILRQQRLYDLHVYVREHPDVAHRNNSDLKLQVSRVQT